MLEGYYDHPKHPRPLESVRIACVIPAYIPQGRKKNYRHYVEDKLDTIKRTLAAHSHYTAGLPYRILLYDNSSPDHEGAAWLKAHGAFVRKNEGYGFGAWKEAWGAFKNDYDFFLFTEDDIAPCEDGWLTNIVQRFLSAPDIGAIGSFVEGRSDTEALSDVVWGLMQHQQDMLYNFDGAFTFTSARVLRQVDEIGGLPVYPCKPAGPYDANVNELVFQQPILQLGYRILSYDDEEHCVVHGSEIFSGNVMHKGKPLTPLVNINGRRKIPAVADRFEWYKEDDD